MWTVELSVMVLMIAINGVLAGYEIALASLPVSRLRHLARDNRTGAAAALSMKENMEASLAAVQLGITLVGAVAAATGGAGAEEKVAPWLQSRPGAGWVVGGGLELAQLKARSGLDLHADLPPGGARTVSDWVSGHLGRAVRGGDVVERGGLRVVVRKARRYKVQEAQLGKV